MDCQLIRRPTIGDDLVEAMLRMKSKHRISDKKRSSTRGRRSSVILSCGFLPDRAHDVVIVFEDREKENRRDCSAEHNDGKPDHAIVIVIIVVLSG